MILETIVDTSTLYGAVAGIFVVGLPAYFTFRSERMKHKREMLRLEADIEKERRINVHESQKINFFNEIMNLTTYSKIKSAADEIFRDTKADRFLILIAINGKDAFNTVSVVMEHHNRHESISAIGKYHNIQIDRHYKDLLRESERRPVVNLNVSKMQDSLLKTFYQMEGVRHSKIRFLARRALDKDNDMLVYSSVATHDEKTWSPNERITIKTVYESQIIPSIRNLLE